VELCVTDNDGAQVCCETDATIEPEPNLPPQCDAGGPYTGNVGDVIQFDGTGSTDPDGTIISYEWDFGDGNSGTGAQPTHTYNAAGQFVVVLCVTDNDQARVCCTTTADITGATPVDLVSFTATAVDGTVLLNWRTGFEQDHAGFEVFRAPDGSDAFERVSGNDLVVDDNQDHAYTFTDRTVEAGTSYLYQLEAVARNGDRQTFDPLRVMVSQAVPGALVLHPSRPNPFNPSTTISFDLPNAGAVTVRIYDGSGRLVRTLADAATFPAGTHSMPWDGLDQRGQGAPSGVYLIKLGSGSRLLTEKIVLTR
jgi:hypothetical protein